jgi:hypothetical protein
MLTRIFHSELTMKRVKRIDNYYTLETKQRSAETDLLCDMCGNGECSIRMILGRVKINRFNAKLAVTRCEAYIPTLDFRDALGMDSEFNTFRLSGAWASRVAPGTLVNLRKTDGSHIGVAEVVQTHVGLFTDMDQQFGAGNHMAIYAEVEGEDFSLGKVMRDAYGGHRFHEDSTVSVIELKRIYSGVLKERA